MDLAPLRSPEGERALIEAVDLVANAGPRPEPLRIADVLRRRYPPSVAAAALTQATLRRRAIAKFPHLDAERMYFTPDGLEQATRASVAGLRARRFAAAAPAHVADLCCGIGSDAIAIARTGLRVTAIDRDPATVDVMRANASALGLADRIEVRCEEVESVDLTAFDAAFCDPARRDPRGRVFDPDAYSPPWSFLLDLPQRVHDAAVKVAPGVPHEVLPPGVEAEWVSDGGDVKEAALWFGDLTSGARRRATLLPSGATLTDDADARPPVGTIGEVLYEPDGAVIRAGLVGECAALVDGRLLEASIAYITADRYVHTPFARAYLVRDVLPAHVKPLRAYLRDRRVGRVVIKKRGIATSPEELRAQLRLAGHNEATVILARTAERAIAVVAEPAPSPSRD